LYLKMNTEIQELRFRSGEGHSGFLSVKTFLSFKFKICKFAKIKFIL